MILDFPKIKYVLRRLLDTYKAKHFNKDPKEELNSIINQKHSKQTALHGIKSVYSNLPDTSENIDVMHLFFVACNDFWKSYKFTTLSYHNSLQLTVLIISWWIEGRPTSDQMMYRITMRTITYVIRPPLLLLYVDPPPYALSQP